MKILLFKTDGDEITYWWLILLAGIVLMIMGVWVIAEPSTSYLSLCTLFSLGMVATGVLEILFAINNHRYYYGWIWTIASGLIDMLLGIYLIATPEISITFLPVIAGLWMLLKGFTAMKNAWDLRSFGFFEWGWVFFIGIMIIILAIMIITDPAFGAFNIILWTGFAFIFAGIFRIYIAFRLKKFKKELE
jgi:uncharacterized membrane protein HdeD (DUF308 family)